MDHHNGGLCQMNGPKPWAFAAMTFINAVKMMDGVLDASGGGAWKTLIDSRGYPTQEPPSGNWVTNSLWIHGDADDVWVLKWPGTAELSLSHVTAEGDVTLTSTAANRKEYTLTGTNAPDLTAARLVRITVNSMAA